MNDVDVIGRRGDGLRGTALEIKASGRECRQASSLPSGYTYHGVG
jgi:hypothetical protein